MSETDRVRTAQRHGWKLTGTWRGGTVLERRLRSGRTVRLLTHQYLRTRVLR